MKVVRWCLALFLLSALAHGDIALCAEAKSKGPKPRKERVKWFREARFGMFIHWGVYAVPAGTWKGRKIPGIGEWIMHRARVPVKEYEKLAGKFNPVKFNAEDWVLAARNAGMKYMVITAKHHDGFAMYHSKCSKYNIVDATPFKRDPMKELAAACKKHGLRFGFYYSHAQDWHHPGGAGNTWDYRRGTKDFGRYFREKVKPQVREILTQYGPLGVIWYDTPAVINRAQSKELAELTYELQPDILINTRIGHGFGDYRSMGDNAVPRGVVRGDWETPATINHTWGFKSYDHNWKSTGRLIRLLVEIVGKGGNYLLNVGPTAEGLIPKPSLDRLAEMGEWLKVNGESIYGAGPTSLGQPSWGRCTTRPGKLYLHVFDWPADGALKVPALEDKVKKAYLLGDARRSALAVKREDKSVVIKVPAKAPDARDTVVVVEVEGKTAAK